MLAPVLPLLAVVLLAAPASVPLPSSQTDDAGSRTGRTVTLFDGTTLAGWVPVNAGPETFTVRDGAILSSGHPTSFLRTADMHQNFILEFDWMPAQGQANAGVLLWCDALPDQQQGALPRGIEVPLGPARNTAREHPPSGTTTGNDSGAWQHCRVIAQDGRCTVERDGTVVRREHQATPRKGYIALTSRDGPVRFRNIQLQEQPGSPLSPEQVAMDGTGYTPLFDGVSLQGWNEGGQTPRHWSAREGTLVHEGRGDTLWTDASYRDFELVADWRWTAEHQGRIHRPFFTPEGNEAKNPDGSVRTIEVEERDSGIYLRGSIKAQINMWMWPCGSGEIWGYRTDPAQSAAVRAACTPRSAQDKPVGEWNRFVIRVQGDRVTVSLNGVVVIDRAPLADMPATGPIGLQSHGSPVEFRNLYIRPLPPAPPASAP